MEQFPEFVLEHMFTFLELSSLGRSTQVCKHWKHMLTDNKNVSTNVWKTLNDSMFGGPPRKAPSEKIALKMVCSELNKIKKQPAEKKLTWAISGGHGNYAAKIWKEESIPVPNVKQMITQAVKQGHHSILIWCMDTAASDYDNWNAVVDSLLARAFTERTRAGTPHSSLNPAALNLVKNLVQLNKINFYAQINTESIFAAAIKSYNMAVLEYLLAGKSIDLTRDCNSKGMNPFHYAAFCGNIDALEMIKQHCMKEKGEEYFKEILNSRTNDEKSTTPLHEALKFRQMESVDWLLENFADVAIPDGFGKRSLHFAAETAELEQFKLIESRGENLNSSWFDPRRQIRMKPIHSAVSCERMDIVRYLISRGVSMNAEGECDSVLFVAKELTIVNELLDLGADPFAIYTSDDNSNMIHFVAKFFRSDSLEISDVISLLQRLKNIGVDANARDTKEGTPFMSTFYYFNVPNLAVAKWFIEEAKADINALMENDSSVFLKAVMSTASDLLLDYLVSVGANVQQMNLGDENALHIAAYSREDDVRLISKLLDYGVEPNKKNEHGSTPLSIVMRRSSMDCVRLLIEKGKADLTNIQGNLSALQVAEEVGNQEIYDYIKFQLIKQLKSIDIK